MQWCCPNEVAEQVLDEQQRKALYIKSLQSHQQNKETGHPQLSHSFSQYPQYPNPHLPTQGSIPIQTALSPSLQKARNNNLILSRSNQLRKIDLWKRSCYLTDRSAYLRQQFIFKNNELQQLTAEIDQIFP